MAAVVAIPNTPKPRLTATHVRRRGWRTQKRIPIRPVHGGCIADQAASPFSELVYIYVYSEAPAQATVGLARSHRVRYSPLAVFIAFRCVSVALFLSLSLSLSPSLSLSLSPSTYLAARRPAYETNVCSGDSM